jgi:imidazolonepropionase-like amidohydrolase
MLLLSVAQTPASSTTTFDLYKWQNRIGREFSTSVASSEGREVRTTFSFTDRGRAVALASLLELGADGAPRRFQIWGDTSRSSTVDDRVVVSADSLTIEQREARRSERRPERFFVGSSYAPMVLTEELWRYWKAHGSPRPLRVIPLGDVAFERRGEDAVTNDEGDRRTLERWAVSGIGWGRETLWFDGEGRLAAAKMVDAELDHFEATRKGYSQALGQLVSSAARDGLAQLSESSPPIAGASGSNPVAIIGARLIDGTGAPPVLDSVVLVDGELIRAAGSRGRVTIPPNARIIDATGKTVLPGLWDMHAHFEQVEWGPLYLAAGVTTVRDCGNELDFIRSVRDAIDSGRGLGPRLLLACAVDSPTQESVGTDHLRSAAEIPALIRKFREARCAQVKIYSGLDPQLIRPLAKAAHAAGMTVTGHVPDGIGAVHANEAGLDMINHIQFVVRALLPPSYGPDRRLPFPTFARALKELDLNTAASRQTLAWFARRKLVVDPTMALTELFTHSPEENTAREPGLAKVATPLRDPLGSLGRRPEDAEIAGRQWNASMNVLRALHRAGVPIVAGTDQGVPGHSLHRELELYVEAGFTPMEAIQAATLLPARVMRMEKAVGTLAAGKRADLIVVEGDPLADIHAIRRVATVMTAGRLYDARGLWQSVGFQP